LFLKYIKITEILVYKVFGFILIQNKVLIALKIYLLMNLVNP